MRHVISWIDQQQKRTRAAGFSLVEICLSLGILAISLTAILGLLPSGFDMTRQSLQQAEASRLLKQLASGIHGAGLMKQKDGVYRYQMLGPGEIEKITWLPGSEALAPRLIYLKTSGMSATTPAEADFVCRIQLIPPVDEWSSGRALLSIAWPATARWRNEAWRQSSGSLKSLVLFRVK